MDVTRTDWRRNSDGEWYRTYTVADGQHLSGFTSQCAELTRTGSTFYEKDNDEGVFYNQDEVPISNQAAIVLGLALDPAQQPRRPPNAQATNQNRSTGAPQGGSGSHYQAAGLAQRYRRSLFRDRLHFAIHLGYMLYCTSVKAANNQLLVTLNWTTSRIMTTRS